MNVSELLGSFKACEGVPVDAASSPDEVDAAWCLRFLRAIRDVSFATVDESGLPSVRVIDVMAVTEDSLYFLAPRGKAFHGDVVREGYVALVGQTSDYRTCRLRGRAVRPEGAELQHALVDAMFELNPSMNLIYPGDARYICDVFCITSGQGEYFDLGRQPIFRRSFTFGPGGGAGVAAGSVRTFVITDRCVGCGTCAARCPQGCVKAGVPFAIEQEHCLHCGICQEACPEDAIECKRLERREEDAEIDGR